ncbi:Phosphopantethiene-protein transferase [Sulfurimonas denitrificans DSM 1251]|jgi:holo-[acyl-carrier protein] synthase|uniref:Holo-[acyl-carrier-protein] synthase n=1 Tax=Sulfurimonas denitrificans (strain ATCC 33889 / DSM 1251) TaxID=326298 RepID=ACPS_SULDN|nr:holo-ACP synthase [Sulfurimonas denitrificans]Q30SB4.1 RecName: Full=Holo-[acyl-carrier-protein] synthase; Short=Holo-ACP synthase; AltName: Full=4'-phosphopantetheinyl transferase AcpS [Sulfurimonas denitrificans DSM 1251]ABB44117.1 Phosphopantethiene-protein transferase [Sulfurimonas denitrificans DSM 1251]MDD3441874.1 holo-ACP synthase [Sulfurimonas denitrificans]
MIGIDIIKISRMGALLERFGSKAMGRFLSKDEIELVKNHKTASGFWAAKEACSKALGVGIGAECGFHDITIFKSSNGAPNIRLSQKIVKEFNVKSISLSITHDGEYAIAVVTIESTAANKI